MAVCKAVGKVSVFCEASISMGVMTHEPTPSDVLNTHRLLCVILP